MTSPPGRHILSELEKPKHYKDLLVWQKAMALAKGVYVLTAKFPAEERFGLISQMRRAAVSVPSNIAEGQARQSTGEFLHFLSRSSGSLAELETQLLLSVELNICPKQETEELIGQIGELQKMIVGLRRALPSPLATCH